VTSAFQAILPAVEAEIDASRAANENRPPEADLVAVGSAVAALLVPIGQLPQSERSSAICAEQCLAATGALQKSLNSR